MWVGNCIVPARLLPDVITFRGHVLPNAVLTTRVDNDKSASRNQSAQAFSVVASRPTHSSSKFIVKMPIGDERRCCRQQSLPDVKVTVCAYSSVEPTEPGLTGRAPAIDPFWCSRRPLWKIEAEARCQQTSRNDATAFQYNLGFSSQ
jgi:hypothetical protein